MQKLVCINHGNLFEISGHTDGLVVLKYALDIHSLKLSLVRSYSWKCKAEAVVLAAASVRVYATGIQSPLILVYVFDKRKRPRSGAFYILCVEVEKITVQKKCKLTLDYLASTKPYNCVRFADGPSIVLHEKTGIHFYTNHHSSQTFKEHSFLYSSLDLSKHDICCARANPCDCKTVDCVQIYTKSNRHFVFTVMQLEAACPNHGNNLLKCVLVCQMFDNTLQTLCTEQFIPREYIPSVSSICIVDVSSENGSVFSSTLYIGTTDAFVLQLSNGNVINCVSLSGTSFTCSSDKYISSIICREDSNRHTAVSNLLICQEKEAKWTNVNKDLKEIETYTDVCDVFAGDFANCGNIQFLLLKEKSLENGQWILTDLSTFHLSNTHGESHEQSGDGLTKNTGAVLKALQSRLQKENQDLIAQKQSCDGRVEFLKEMCVVGTSENSRKCQVGMVSLVKGEDNIGQQRTRPQEPTPDVDVKGVWQRTSRGRWCIGVDVINKSGRELDLALDIVLSHGADLGSVRSLCSTAIGTDPSKLGGFGSQPSVRLPLKLPCGSSVAQRSTTDNASTNVTGTTPIPDFCMSSQCSASVLLHQSASAQSCQGANNISTREPADDGHRVCNKQDLLVPCGQLKLTSSDVVTGKFEARLGQSMQVDNDLEQLRETHRDWLAVKQTLNLTQLSIISSPGTLSALESLLSDRCGLNHSQVLDCFTSSHDGLDCALILGPVCSQNSRNMDVYTSSERGVFLVLHHLYQCLPDNIAIVPRKCSSSTQKQNLCLRMSQEIHSLADEISQLLDDREHHKEGRSVHENGESVQDGSGDDEGVRRVGEKFKISREKLIKAQTDTLSRSQTLELASVIEERQKWTDLTVATSGNI